VTSPDPADKPRPVGPDDAKPFEVMSSLWGEYEYRHDMVWKLAFRITAVAAALLIAPFLADESVPNAVGRWLVALPLLAIVVIGGGLFTLQSELRRLGLIRDAYRQVQRKVLEPYLDANELDELEHERVRFNFDRRVRVYFYVLLVAAIIYVVAMWRSWLPDLVDQPREGSPSPSGSLTGDRAGLSRPWSPAP
jgi:hypothetical protein